MEFTEYIRIFRKWIWLILLCGFVGGGISFIINTGQPPVYAASTTIAIGQYINDPNPNTTAIYTGLSLVETYAELVGTNDVLQGTIDALNLPLTPEGLRNLFDTKIVQGTSLLVVTVHYTDPILVADIANTLAQQLISRSPTNLTTNQQVQVDYANAQISDLDKQIKQQRDGLTTLDAQIAASTDPQTITQLTDLRTAITSQITQASAAIAQFQSTVSSIEQRTNSLDIVERATIPTSPLGSSTLTPTFLGVIAGVAIAGGIAVFVEYLDDRVKTTEIAAQVLELPVLGAIPQFAKKKTSYADALLREEDTLTPIAESYRRLQTNLTFSSNGNHKLVYVVTSSGPGEGKSVTASNLATTMAVDGSKVLLIDADLRRPSLHEIFGLENQIGLSTLLIAESETAKVRAESRQEPENFVQLNQCIQTTAIPNLKVITSGFAPSNPTQAIRSALMKRWLDAFRSARDIDIIIIDSPPILLFSDSAILASVAEANTILIVDSQHTRVKVATEGIALLGQMGVEVKGVVLNRINPRDEIGRYGQEYNNGYYYSDAEREDKGNRLRNLFRR